MKKRTKQRKRPVNNKQIIAGIKEKGKSKDRETTEKEKAEIKRREEKKKI